MKRIVSILCALTVLVTVFSHPAEAATGMQGYAAYRDGVIGNFEWHAAIMDKASSDDIYPVVHAPGISQNVQYGSWDDFLNGNTFMGYYKPASTSISSTKRDQVTATARSLAANFIGYTFVEQMSYDDGYNPDNKTTVGVSDIRAMRCDGVVEYCYEVNNVRIYGNDTYWDISRWGFNYRNHHYSTNIGPQEQALYYMTLVPSNS